MNLFQTSSVIDQFLNYKYQTKLKEQQGGIDTGIADSKNETAITTTSMETESAEKRNTESNLFRLGEKVIDKAPEIVGIGIGGYTVGKSINNNNKNSGGKSGPTSNASNESQRYKEVSDQLDKMIGNNTIGTLKDSALQIKNIDAVRYFPSQLDTIKDSSLKTINNSAFSIPDIIPVVTTGLGAIGMSLSSLAFM